MEIYLGVLDSNDLAPGAYHYDVRHHRLEMLPGRTDISGLRDTIFVTEAAESASMFIVVTAVFGRSRIKYSERAYRFALMEAGHIMQNVALTCTSLSIGFCPFGGFVDDEVNALLGLDGLDEAALYLGTLGTVTSPDGPRH
jgi:SagB-type dehydrogenase family enzyme